MKNETQTMSGGMKIVTSNTEWYINYDNEEGGFNVQSKSGHDWHVNSGGLFKTIDAALKYVRTNEKHWQG